MTYGRFGIVTKGRVRFKSYENKSRDGTASKQEKKIHKKKRVKSINNRQQQRLVNKAIVIRL